MKLIRIDDDVWNLLKKKAVPLEDNPNSVLRRLLNLEESDTSERNGTKVNRVGKGLRRKRRGKRLRRGSGRTDQKEFRLPILEILNSAGGKLEAQSVFKTLEKNFKNKLQAVDYQQLRSGQIRWINTARWARNELVSDGLISKASERGVWEITDKGRARVVVDS